MPLPNLLPITPFTHPARGGVELPGSKSITNRALLLAALAEGPATLSGALFSDDTRIMAEALRKLGFRVVEDPSRKAIRVLGLGGRIPAREAAIDVGLAGTAARFLTALCASAAEGVYRIDGVPQMRKRPMKGLFDALRSQGAEIRHLGGEDHLPVEIVAHGLSGGRVEIDTSESSQMLSAMLMVAPLAGRPTDFLFGKKVREPFVRMTLDLMEQFGAESQRTSPESIQVSKGAYRYLGLAAGGGLFYEVEPDASAASYFIALPLAVGGGLGPFALTPDSCQGDAAFAGVLAKAGLVVESDSSGFTVSHGPSTRATGVTEDFYPFSDTFLTLAAIAPLLKGATRITGIAHTRKQETDRVAGAARELRKLGQEVEESEDSIMIHPRPLAEGQAIETYGDHRFAMSFAILGCHDLHGDGTPWLSIKDPGCCAKTFPEFFEVLDGIRKRSLP